MELTNLTISGGMQFVLPSGGGGSAPTLLMHFDGTNGSNVFTNSSCFSLPFFQDPNASPQATLTTSNFKFGTASLDTGFTPSPGNRGINIGGIYTDAGTGVSGALDIWPGDFTIEGWLYSSYVDTGLSVSRNYFYYYGTDWGIRLDAQPTTLPTIIIVPTATSGSGGDGSMSGMFTTVNTWNHVAIVRYGTAVNFYLNGVKDSGSRTQTGAWTGTARPTQFWIGGTPASPSPQWNAWEGNIDEMRITKSAVYTANFTPPTAPFPNPVC